MKLLFSIPLEENEQPDAALSECYAGVLCVHEGQYVYCRQTYTENQMYLKEYRFTREGQLLGASLYALSKPHALNYQWRHYTTHSVSCVAIGSEWGFDLTYREFFSLTDPLRARYIHDTHADEPYYHSEHSFSFPPYEIAHKGEFGYVCTFEDRPVWSFRTQGYLYTDMIQYNNAVVFGTAGFGGHFVALRLTDGRPLFDINTKGTDRYLYDGKFFYTYAGGKNGLLAASLCGAVKTLPLPGATDYDCPLCLDRDRILCLSCEKKSSSYTTVHLNTVCIEE